MNYLNANEFALSLQEFDLGKLFRQIAADHYDMFEEKNICLEIDIPATPINIWMDKSEMNRALSNLIVNAYMHNSERSNVLLQITNLDKDQIKIVIADDGLVIPKENHDDLFKPFFINDDARRKNAGSGLGLAITKAVIEKHGYHVAIEERKDSKYTKAFIIYCNKFIDNGRKFHHQSDCADHRR